MKKDPAVRYPKFKLSFMSAMIFSLLAIIWPNILYAIPGFVATVAWFAFFEQDNWLRPNNVQFIDVGKDSEFQKYLENPMRVITHPPRLNDD
jgi:hypothetical protein